MQKEEISRFHAELNIYLGMLCKKWNLEKIKSNITYSATDMSITIKLNEKNLDGTFKVDEAKNAKIFFAVSPFIPKPLVPEKEEIVYLGLRFFADGTEYQIIDWNNRARSYPIIYKRLSDNSQFKCSASWIAPHITKTLVAKRQATVAEEKLA